MHVHQLFSGAATAMVDAPPRAELAQKAGQKRIDEEVYKLQVAVIVVC
jgi:hypothetical protein